MTRFSVIIARLFIETLLALAAAHLAVTCIVPFHDWSGALLDAVLLAAIAGPFVCWRCWSAVGRLQSRTSDAISLSRHPVTLLAGLAVASGMGLSMVVAMYERGQIEANARERFSHIAEHAHDFLSQRFKHLPGLIGARALYDASKGVEPEELAAYVVNRELIREFPHTPVIGALAIVPSDEVSHFEQSMQDLGVTDYRARPAPDVSSHMLVQMVEPAARAGALLGHDLSSHPGLLADLDAAIELDRPRLSVAASLPIEHVDRHYSIWLVPVYRNGMPKDTAQERRAALDVVLFAPIHTAGVGHEILADLDHLADVEVFDGPERNADNVLLDADGHLAGLSGPISDAQYSGRSQIRTRHLPIGGRVWTISVTSTPKFEATVDRSLPHTIALAGCSLSLLLGGLLWSMGTARGRAECMARAMTAELSAAKERAEEHLREAHGLRSAIQHQAIYSEADTRGRITEVNELFCAISGYSREELLGQDHRIINSGTHPKSFWVDVWRTLASGRTWRGEVCNRAKNGSLYWVDSIIAPFRNAEGTIEKYVSIRFDVTEKKRIQAQVAASEARFRTLVEGADVIVWEYDVAAGHFTYVSPQAARLGYALEAWLEPGFWQSHIHEDDREQAIHYCFAEALAGRAHRLQYRMRCADQSVMHIDDFVTVEMEDGKPVTMRGVLIDVTEQVKHRQALRQQANRMDLTVRSANLGTWDWNIVTGEVTFNDIAQTMLGYEGGEWSPHVSAWERLIHPDDLDAVRRCVDDHLEGRTGEYRCEHRLRRKDGTWAWILDTGCVTERNGSGDPIRAMGVHIDVTAARLAADRLRDAQAQAESASRAKSEFLANMSHEIRTPMTAILGYADLLSDADALSAENRLEYVDTIKRNGGHLLSIINDILDLSKIEAGKMTIESVPVDPRQVLLDIEILMIVKARARGISFTIEQDTPLPAIIYTDPVRLRQILVNLVGNAIKFTEIGGVTIRAAFDPASPTGPRLRLSVVDTGIGISAEQQARLFNAFQQADTSTTRRFGGSGLGLRISQTLAQILGGEVSVASHPGRGSSFTLTIATGSVAGISMTEPATLEGSRPRPIANAESTMPLAGLRILLAEDGPDNQRLIAFYLRTAGAEVLAVENGRLAMELLTADGTVEGPLTNPSRIDLIVTDMQMPEMDGYTFARLARDKGWNLPIIALTAHAMQGDDARCTNAGCDAYASKPIDRAALIELCRTATSKHRRAAA